MNVQLKDVLNKMGVDYAIKIGVGAYFSDDFLRLVPQSILDRISDTTDDGHTVLVEVLYKEMNLQMHCGDSAPYPVLPPSTLTHAEILARALAVLKITDEECSVVEHILRTYNYVKTGMFMVHYAW